MQGRDEYEADYYGGAPMWPGNNNVMMPGRTCCQGRINELLEEMERALSMQSENVRKLFSSTFPFVRAFSGAFFCASIPAR